MAEMMTRSVQAASLNTGDTDTTQDFTVSGFGTPTAWVVTVCEVDQAGQIQVDAGLSVGWSDGSTSASIYFGAEDGVVSGPSSTHASSDIGGTYVARMLTPGATGYTLRCTSSTTTDGVTLSYVTTPSASLFITVDLISCDAAEVGTADGSMGAETLTGTFEPTAIITGFANGITSATNGWRGCLGFAAQTTGGTITQGCWSQRFRTTLNAPPDIGQLARTGSFSNTLSSTLVESRYTLTSFDASGFSWTLDTGSHYDFPFLALRAADSSFWAGWTATSTTPTLQSVTSPGFGCGGGWITSTFLDATNTVDTSGGICSSGFHSWNGTEEFSSSVVLQDDSDPTVASSYASAQGFDVLEDDGTLALSGTVSGVGSGFSIDFSVADGTARYFLALVYEAGTVYEAIDEGVTVTESALGAAFQAIGETVTVSEGVESMMILSPPMEVSMEGESGGPTAVQGESGGPSVEEGHG